VRNPVGWFDINVSDINRAAPFYETVLAVELTDLSDPTEENIVMKAFPCNMDEYGASGALTQMPDVPVGQNSTVVYFSCDDCALEASRVDAAGGQLIKPKFPIGDFGFIAMCLDTEGNVFGLHSMK